MKPDEFDTFSAMLLTPVFKWIPGIIAIFFSYKERISFNYFKASLATGLEACCLGICIPTTAFVLSLPFTSLNLDRLSSHTLSLLLFYTMPCNILFALGEEIMWRGYFFAKIARHSFLKQSLITGGIWGFLTAR